LIWLVLLVIPLAAALIWALQPMRIQRDPSREGPQEGEAVAAYDRTSHWPVFSLERFLIMREIRRDQPAGLVLDIGCGPGFLAAEVSRRFSAGRVIALDINRSMLEIARKRWSGSRNGNLEFLAGDVQHLPLADGSVDYIISSLSLHHWQDAPAAFREIQRVLRPGGRCLIFDLRRDAPHIFYYGLTAGQMIIAPRAIKETNGAAGSFWSSYTAEETNKMLASIHLSTWKAKKHLAWLTVRGLKE
jgi:ubiquinone/menaquinone biosynthesis C-methylase UbiE